MSGRPPRRGDQVDVAWPVAQPAWAEAPLGVLPAIAVRRSLNFQTAIEPRAAIGLDALAAVVEQQTVLDRTPRAVDDVGDAGDLEQPGGQRLSVGVGVARLRGARVG